MAAPAIAAALTAGLIPATLAPSFDHAEQPNATGVANFGSRSESSTQDAQPSSGQTQVEPTDAVFLLPGLAATGSVTFTASPKRVVLNQSYELIKWSLTGTGLSDVDSVDANLEHTATRSSADFDFTFDGETTGQFKLYDWERPGNYTVYGDVWDYDYNKIPSISTPVTVKAASSTRLSARRSGAKVTLEANARRYDGGYPVWAANRGATLQLQRKAGSNWSTFARRTVPRSGVVTVSVRDRRAKVYRALTGETSRAWSSTSGRVRR